MINRQDLLKDLQQQLPKIEQDILAYSESKPELTAHLKDEYQKAVDANRTADHFVAWREGQITQAAVAWILTCVFVRFLEDNQLLDAPVLAGPGERLKHAKDRIEVHFNDNPTHGERDYLLALFAELEALPAIKELLDHNHNPLWQIPVSSDGAKLLVDFFQKIDPETGEIIHDFTDGDWDTRFLGDLYQDLSIAVQKKYALLQTPEFVESFILDYTLEKAKETFGLKGLRMIDPTCGSGHFLLTGFERIFDDWCRREPGEQTRVLAQRALDSVYGVDLNPYAIAICRFRLLIAAMKVTHTQTMRQAPDFHFNLAVGDSLLHGRRFESTSGIQSHLMEEDDPIKHVLEVEDKEKLSRILGQQYHAVVGNPPYITVKDKALRTAYKEKYPTCFREYSLGVPFTERFFDLTLPKKDSKPAGFMGMITTNSFMKREFGKPLVEKYLSNRDLTHIIDTSGAYIPGHGTPTVILFARNQQSQSDELRAALGIKGEPTTSTKPEKGLVWTSIANNIDVQEFENEFVSICTKSRTDFKRHPWSLSGGTAPELKKQLELANHRELSDVASDFGFLVITGDDDVLVLDRRVSPRASDPFVRKYTAGEDVRNWCNSTKLYTQWPYDEFGNAVQKESLSQYIKNLWPHRVGLKQRKLFSVPVEQKGVAWYQLREVYKKKLSTKLTISFPFVSTHNHFLLDRGEPVFNRTSPVIKLCEGSSERDHFVALGFLNSSVACFWGRQVFFPKGGFADGKWEERLEWDGTKLKRFPIPKPINLSPKERDQRLLAGYGIIEKFAGSIDALASQYSQSLPNPIMEACWEGDIADYLDHHHEKALELHHQMVALQEELDWQCYQHYGLLKKAYLHENDLPQVKPGERAFEIVLARKVAAGEASAGWFERHEITQITEIPSHWPESYQALVKQRIELIENERFIRLIEQPEYKRRWLPIEWKKQEQAALKNWMLSHLEQSFSTHEPEVMTCAALADQVRNNEKFKQVAIRYTGNELFDIQKLIIDLVAGESIPQMAPARYKPSGITKFRAWQETWDKQRQEDAIDARTELPEDHQDYLSKEAAEHLKQKQVGDIPVPPKYATRDFAKPAYWPLRGKLDVPKERFFSLPGCEKSGDTTPVIGWAGMNHLQRTLAIVGWYQARKEEDGFTGEKLMPMLVAIDELVPWLKQWHNEIDPEYELRMGDYFEGWLNEELQELDISRDDLLNWTPPVVKKTRARKTKAKAKA